jgi:sugar O-acyltransferase (sialic acid O-acetyltransferase NeuD family)
VKGLILVGGGGHCRSCIDVIEAGSTYAITGIVDRAPVLPDQLLGYTFLGTDALLPELVKLHRNALVSVGQINSPRPRMRLYTLLRSIDAILPTIVSPHGYVSRHAQVGEGTVVFHGAIVNAAGEVGKNCIINSRALIEHDALVGDHCHVSTGAIVNGGCNIGEGTFIGSGAVLHQGVRVGAACIIAAGAVVKADIPDGTTFRATR